VSSGDYSGMGRFSSSSDLELDQLLSEAGDVRPENRHLADALRLTRRSVAPLDPAARRHHLAAMSGAASELRSVPAEEVPVPTSPTWRRIMRRSWATTLKLSAATMAASLSLAGLASAQVDLPGTASESAVEAVLGLELPTPAVPDAADSGKSISDDVQAVIDGTAERGCEFGQSVSDAASSNSQGSGAENSSCDQEDSSAQDAAAGEEHSRDGRATASEASDGRSDLGSENAGTHNDAGQTQAEEASDNDGVNNGSDNGAAGADNAGTNDDQGHATAEEKSAEANEQGETKSAEGKSHKPSDDDPTDGDI
jgi:hypothetical protein